MVRLEKSTSKTENPTVIRDTTVVSPARSFGATTISPHGNEAQIPDSSSHLGRDRKDPTTDSQQTWSSECSSWQSRGRCLFVLTVSGEDDRVQAKERDGLSASETHRAGAIHAARSRHSLLPIGKTSNNAVAQIENPPKFGRPRVETAVGRRHGG